MKRMLLLVTVGLMLAAAMALSGVAQAAPISDKADAQCAKLAIKTFGPSFNPSNYTFHGGTVGEDDFTFNGGDGSDVYCGFGSNDQIETLNEGDIFLGGEGNDRVAFRNHGTFNGGAGNDRVVFNAGTFNGGDGDDFVSNNEVTGTVNGEVGTDSVVFNAGTFNGGEGNDRVENNEEGGTFNGGEGCDSVDSGRPPADGPEGPCTI
jgi:Ca2+-binding RTX toxin-like protein